MPKKVAVTGATGFLGLHLTRTLCDKGFDVQAFARDAEKASTLPESASVHIGDISDRSVAAEVVTDCEWVFHTVSNFRTASGLPDSYHRINVDGTACMLEVAQRAGVKRFVHVSTIGVHGDVRSTPATEDAPFNPGDLYQETKLDAENLVREATKISEMEIVVIRPCSMYGPGDLRMLKMFKMLSSGTFFKVGPCRENFHAVYITDIVNGLVKAAATPDISGQVFILGGAEYLPLEDYIDTAASVMGARTPRIRLPYRLLISAAWLFEKSFIPLGLEPPLHIRRVRFFKNNRAFSISKAREALGYDPKISLRDGMARTVQWYREQGMLPPQQT